jgi:hypothetical protein
VAGERIEAREPLDLGELSSSTAERSTLFGKAARLQENDQLFLAESRGPQETCSSIKKGAGLLRLVQKPGGT